MSADDSNTTGTLAQGVMPDGSSNKKTTESRPTVIYLPADTDWRKLAIAIIEACGYVVATKERPERGGRPAGIVMKDLTDPETGKAITLPTGVVLREHVRVVKEAARAEEGVDLTDKEAVLRILDGSLKHDLKGRGKSAREIKATIEKTLKNMLRRLGEGRTPRKRKPSSPE